MLEKTFLKEPHTIRVLLVSGNNALLGLELAKASDVKSQRRLLGWWTELLGKGGQNMLGHGEDHLVVVAQKHQEGCAQGR